MPYRIDIRDPGDHALDRLVALGALDVEVTTPGRLAALMPDSVTREQLTRELALDDVTVSAVTGRDNDSVWVLTPRSVRAGSLRIVPAHLEAGPGDLRLVDSPAFGTGLHPTTALCLEAIEESVTSARPRAVLDVGTGSGVLALAALMLGVPCALAIDVDDHALRTALDNARLNELDTRLKVAHGGPETVTGTWPLVLANILAAPLVEMAPALVRRVGHLGELVLSGIPHSAELEVTQAYVHLGMRRVNVRSRVGWVALTLRASW
jgi:ribosomal protein L11 methyltransferase